MGLKRFRRRIARKFHPERIRVYFSRRYIPETTTEPRDLSPDGMLVRVAAVRQEMDPHIYAAWTEIRKWISRGHGGGLLSALTLAGSQSLGGPLKTPIFWLVSCFLCGLAALLLRQIVLAWKAEESRRGRIAAAIDIEDGFDPAEWFDGAARLFDYLALLALIIGGAMGIAILFEMTAAATTLNSCP
jgi:hypothetical protein